MKQLFHDDHSDNVDADDKGKVIISVRCSRWLANGLSIVWALAMLAAADDDDDRGDDHEDNHEDDHENDDGDGDDDDGGDDEVAISGNLPMSSPQSEH